MRILEHYMKCGAKVYTVKDGYELGDNIQSKVMALAFGLSAEIERDLISQRTKEALLKLNKQGKKLGREVGSKNKKRKLDDKIEIINELLIKKVPKTRIAKQLKVSVPTLYTFISTINSRAQMNLISSPYDEGICPLLSVGLASFLLSCIW